MRIISILFVLGFLFTACTKKEKPVKPKDLIAKDKMEQILYDLYILNAAKGVNSKILESKRIKPETYLLTKHNIDSTQFANSNAFYAFDADEYKVLVENVKARLEKDKETFAAQQKAEEQREKRRRDSLTKANRKKKDSIVKSKNPVRS